MSAGIPIVRFYCPSSSRLPFRVYFPKTAAKKDTSRILSGMSRSMGSPHAGQIHDSHTLKTDWGQTVRASCWMRTASSVCRKVLVIDKVWIHTDNMRRSVSAACESRSVPPEQSGILQNEIFGTKASSEQPFGNQQYLRNTSRIPPGLCCGTTYECRGKTPV